MIDGLKLYAAQEDVLRELEAMEGNEGLMLVGLLQTVGFDTISFLKSLTSEMRPPARPGETERQAHPGHWADITGNLAGAYRFEVRANGRKVFWSEESLGEDVPTGGVMPSERNLKGPFELIFINDMEYAAYLEAKEGYFVLSGVTDPGGPIDRALREVINRVPGWSIAQ